MSVTQQQLESFTEALIRARVIEESELKDNRDLIIESLKLSQSREGLPMVIYNHTDMIGSEIIKSPAMNANFPEQVLTKPTYS
jgi:hypothetical protein